MKDADSKMPEFQLEIKMLKKLERYLGEVEKNIAIAKQAYQDSLFN